jgi:hypothetical protein
MQFIAPPLLGHQLLGISFKNQFRSIVCTVLARGGRRRRKRRRRGGDGIGLVPFSRLLKKYFGFPYPFNRCTG